MVADIQDLTLRLERAPHVELSRVTAEASCRRAFSTNTQTRLSTEQQDQTSLLGVLSPYAHERTNTFPSFPQNKALIVCQMWQQSHPHASRCFASKVFYLRP